MEDLSEDAILEQSGVAIARELQKLRGIDEDDDDDDDDDALQVRRRDAISCSSSSILSCFLSFWNRPRTAAVGLWPTWRRAAPRNRAPPPTWTWPSANASCPSDWTVVLTVLVSLKKRLSFGFHSFFFCKFYRVLLELPGFW